MPPKPRTVLITAGTKRLGLEMAKKCLDMNYAVVLHYRSDKTEAEKWIKRNTRFANRIQYIKSDLRDNPALLTAEAASKFGRLDGLINNASIFNKGDLRTLDHFNHLLRVNTLIPLELAHAFCTSFKKGWIINITDANIYRHNAAFQNYRLSKRFLEDITAQLECTFAPAFRVNAIAPGAMLPAPGNSRREFERLKQHIPLKKTGPIQSLHLALEYCVNNSYVTGQVLYIDGGRHLV
ncbi:MAG: SDR family NAD(P)-dependent oxidoreductase [Chitinivibrionales bacterium]|nr:SDR family NAD(P)-dependent oxidoreductase [Chitinivibrionales bacterium]